LIYEGVWRHSYNMNYKLIAESFGKMWNIAIKRHGSQEVDHSLMTRVINTGWLTQIENLLMNAIQVWTLLTQNNENVLIYCPKGTTGASILSSLTQIFIDPYYRTIEGFRVLFYKEWIYYRHNFVDKN